MPHRYFNVPEFGMREAYAALLAARGYRADAAQQQAADRLQRLYTELLDFRYARRSTMRRLLSSTQPPRGVYFWGGVGRGKSFLMDCFFDSVPIRRKRRIHFHAFMQQVHRRLDEYKDDADPMEALAAGIAHEVRLLCFDEFHVSDIADAMILGRLLQALFARGVVFVMTSNYPPERLYPNGLQRDRFLPTIALLQERMDVIEVEAGVDYRLRTLEQVEIYHFPADAAAEAKMAEWFDAIDGGAGEAGGGVDILGRRIATRRRGHGAIWFDFAAICGGPRSQNDYLELAQAFHTVLVSGIPRMGAANANEARRFTWLVDVFYDHKVKLIATAECEAGQLYTEGVQAGEFFRTVSRLTEMRSREYLALQHLSG